MTKARHSCHRRKHLQPCFVNSNRSSDPRCNGSGAKFVLLKIAASSSFAMTGNPP